MSLPTRTAPRVTQQLARSGLVVPRAYLPSPTGPQTTTRRRRRWGWLVPILAVVAGSGFLWHWTHPATLAAARLDGVRGPGCLRLLIAADVSGSMERIAEPRNAAVRQLLAWAPANLRDGDEIALIDFAGDAVLRFGPTPLGEPVTANDASPDGNGTQFTPVLNTITSLPTGRCRSALLLISDGQLHDLPAGEADATTQLTNAGIHSIDLIVPGITEVNPAWSALYPTAPPDVFDGTNPDATAVTIARHIAGMTGQSLHTVY